MRPLIFISAFALAAIGTVALSQPRPPLADQNAIVIAGAFTDQTPSPDQIRARTPAAAVGLKPTPTAMLICEIGDEGRPLNCVVNKESPEGLGLGAAALELAPLYRFAPGIVDVAKGRRTTVAVFFGEPWKAPPPPPRVSIITRPEWVSLPSAAAVNRVYPKAARNAGIDGRVVLSCVVQKDGSVSDCAVAAESPAEQGFGPAALSLTGQFRMKPQTAPDGTPIGGARVRIPLNFRANG